MGFLYIIGSRDLTKIGITVDIRRRMNELKPDQIYQVVELPNPRELEKELHRLFDAKRLPGSEYFDLNHSERREVCSLARDHGKEVPFSPSHQTKRKGLKPETKRKGLRPGVILGICGLGLAVASVVAVLSTRLPPKRQPQTAPEIAPVSVAPPTKSFVSV